MSKVISVPFEDSKHEKLKKMLSEDSTSYVFITCSEPSKEGEMEVEMSYKGDRDLIAYLIKNTQSRFE